MTQEYEVIIIGGGPAGLSAGILVARQRVSCLLISKDLGGQLNLIRKLENYPGTIMSSGSIRAKTLVVDPGKVPNNLGVENESSFVNKGVHYCTKCDAPFYQGRTTAVIGVGAYLLESGILLSRMASKIYLIYKGGALGGDKEMIASIEKKENIELVPQSSVKAISGINNLQSITIVDNSGQERVVNVDGLFIEMGSKINLDFIKHLVKINSKSEIEITADGKTSHPAIFAAGDASSIPYKQIIAACSGGATAGLSACNYVEKLKDKPGVRADWKKTIGDTVFHY